MKQILHSYFIKEKSHDKDMKKSYLYICVELNVYLFITQVRIVCKCGC